MKDVQAIKDAVKNWPKMDVPQIRERVKHPQGNEIMHALMGLVWKGIDTEVFKYPKRTDKQI